MRNYDVIVVGSGAAGFSTADWLHTFGIKNICIVTEGINSGTSRNTGSDKQTYYKLDLCSYGGDSVIKMAQDLFLGGSMNGSDALTQAANSTRCFMRLAELGVPFPTDGYGRYAGYRTDHDNTMRATSAGPLTSKYMTEALQKKVIENGTEILDGHRVVKLIVQNDRCFGVVCHTADGFKKIYAKAVILCTGAPAAIYSRSVYPESQHGATGLAIEAGAELQNFQEWQYGIASLRPRWNLSGSYQQVVPKYFSLSECGEKKEFLAESGNIHETYSKVFLKGYQWPFDSKKINGSSEIDLMIFRELEKGNRVFIDYTENPTGFDFLKLSEEAREYLQNADCLAETPFERLKKLNPKAVELYRSHGIDLGSQPLEIGICAQHNNGGIRTDTNSESSVRNLFAVGEAAGKFGVCRPGGSALNDTQVGGLRAAQYLAKVIDDIDFEEVEAELLPSPKISAEPNFEEIKKELTLKMTDRAGIFRDSEKIAELIAELEGLLDGFFEKVTVSDASLAGELYSFRLTALSMLSLCRTELDSIEKCGSRGGCLCYKNGKLLPENEEYRKYITVTCGDTVKYVSADEIPNEKIVFEKLLRQA